MSYPTRRISAVSMRCIAQRTACTLACLSVTLGQALAADIVNPADSVSLMQGKPVVSSATPHVLRAAWIQSALGLHEAVTVVNATVDGTLDLRDSVIVTRISMTHCRFTGKVDFSYAKAGGRIVLSGGVFENNVTFQSAALASDLICDEVTFKGRAEFTDLHVKGSVSIQESEFDGFADFSRVAFGHTSFVHTRLAASEGALRFPGAVFTQDVRFDKVRSAGQAIFTNVSIAGDADFHDAVFEQVAQFDGITIGGSALFSNVRFNSTDTVGFALSVIHGIADFQGATFRGFCDFASSRVFQQAEFAGAAFEGGARFAGARFDGDALFSATPARPATFSGVVNFGSAQFAGLVSFAGARFDASAGAAAFTHVDVHGVADFQRADFRGLADFSGAHFAQDAQFVGVAFNCGARFTAARFEGAARFGAADRVATTFGAPANFSGAQFSGIASFVGARFSDTASFRAVRMESGALFNSPVSDTTPAHFSRIADFTRSFFGERVILQRVVFDSGLTCAGAVFDGELKMDGLVITGKADFSRCKFSAPARFTRVRFAGAASFSEAVCVSLSFADSGVVDRAPQFNGPVDLRNATYERIHANLDSLLPHLLPYDRQPYSQLEATLRQMGLDRAADSVHIAQNLRERELLRTDGPWFRWLLNVIYYTVARYGVRSESSWRLAVIAGMVLMLGAVFFRRPGTVAMNAAVPGTEQPRLKRREALMLCVRIFLPVDIPMGAQWSPLSQPVRVFRYVVVRPSTVATVIKLAGWILVPLGLAALTGVLLHVSG